MLAEEHVRRKNHPEGKRHRNKKRSPGVEGKKSGKKSPVPFLGKQKRKRGASAIINKVGGRKKKETKPYNTHLTYQVKKG